MAGNIRLEKIKMPHFEGGIRDYPQFRKDFQTQILLNLTEITAPYTLRSCLGKDALAQVKIVDDNIDEMWKRLDEKFGNPTKVTDTKSSKRVKVKNLLNLSIYSKIAIAISNALSLRKK